MCSSTSQKSGFQGPQRVAARSATVGSQPPFSMTWACEAARWEHRPSCQALDAWNHDLLLNSLDRDLPLRHDRDVSKLVQELHLWHLFSVAQLGSTTSSLKLNLRYLDWCSAHLDCGTCLCVITESSPTSSMNCGRGCWTSVTTGTSTTQPRTALAELTTSFALSGWAMHGVALQPGTSTIQSVIRFEILSWTTSAISSTTCGTGT